MQNPPTMAYSPKEVSDRINTTNRVWKLARPTKSFAGYTLAQFEEKVKPSLDARATIDSLQSQMTIAVGQRDDADAVSLEVIKAVVNAVKGDPTETADSEFYEALGFVRESNRKSGLHRTKTAAVAPAKA